jgi:hypothetical protein
MAEKTAGKRLFKKLPLSEDDKRVRVLRAIDEPAEAAAAIYGTQARAALERVNIETGEILPAEEAPADLGAASESQQAGEADLPEAASPPPASPVPGEDDPEPTLLDDAASRAAQVRIPGGAYKGLTLAQVADDPKGEEWFAWAARNQNRSSVGPEVHAALQHFRPSLFDPQEK